MAPLLLMLLLAFLALFTATLATVLCVIVFVDIFRHQAAPTWRQMLLVALLWGLSGASSGAVAACAATVVHARDADPGATPALAPDDNSEAI